MSTVAINPEILVIGTGAVGGFYGGKLAQAGAKVSTLCRSDFDIVKSQGIIVESCWSDFKFVPQKVIREPQEYDSKPDYVLVALKALPQLNIYELIRSVVGPGTSIVLLQNGIDIECPVAKAFPKNEIISGLAFICVSRTAPGTIRHFDYGRLTIGCFPHGISEKVRRMCELLTLSGVPCEISDNIVTERWKKLVWNAPYNAISVLGHGKNTREIMECPESVHLVKGIMREVCEVAESAGHHLPRQIVDQHLEQTVVMKPYKTSMLLDHEAEKPMEIEAIYGNTIRIAKRNRVEIPNIICIYGLLKLISHSRARLHSSLKQNGHPT